MEKRLSQRTPFSCKLMITHPELGQEFGRCQDVSDTGLFVCLDQQKPIAVGQRLTLKVVSGLPKGKTIQTRVVRVNQRGLGLQFIA